MLKDIFKNITAKNKNNLEDKINNYLKLEIKNL